MTETRIRWTEDRALAVWSGHVGALGEQLFTIAAPLLDGRSYLLMSRLPGMDFSCSRSRLEEAQEAAERWLSEFVGSLGAAFPEPGFEFDDDDGEPLEVKYAPGRRVRYIHPDYGYPGEQESAAAILVLGAAYIIAQHSIGQSRTNLILEGIPGEWFNSVLFEPVDDVTPAPTAGEKE